jgi:hypothetical protein
MIPIMFPVELKRGRQVAFLWWAIALICHLLECFFPTDFAKREEGEQGDWAAHERV